MAKYTPPEQSKGLQLFDVICVVVAIFLALWFPLYMGWAARQKVPAPDFTNQTWESLGQTAGQIEQWKKILTSNGVADGDILKTAQGIIESKWDYTISPLNLIVLAVALIGYFVFLFKASDKEYRDVIDEKFNGK